MEFVWHIEVDLTRILCTKIRERIDCIFFDIFNILWSVWVKWGESFIYLKMKMVLRWVSCRSTSPNLISFFYSISYLHIPRFDSHNFTISKTYDWGMLGKDDIDSCVCSMTYVSQEIMTASKWRTNKFHCCYKIFGWYVFSIKKSGSWWWFSREKCS